MKNFISSVLKFKFILVILFATILARWGLGDINSRLAAVGSSDDGPVLYTMISSNPEYFADDPVSTISRISIFASLQNSLGVLTHSLGIPPEIYFEIVTLAQTVLLALLFYLFGKIYFKNEYGWLLTLSFLFVFPFYQINLANYGHIQWAPYAFSMAFPLVGLAYMARKMNYGRTAFILFLIAGFWHPTCALMGAAIYSLEKFIENGFQISATMRQIKFALTIPLFFVPGIIASRSGERVPDAIWMKSLSENQHAFPFAVAYEGLFRLSLIWVGIVVFFALAFIKFDQRHRNLLLAVFSTCLLFQLTHLAGIYSGSISLLLLLGGRTWVFLAFIVIQLIIFTFFELIDRYLRRFKVLQRGLCIVILSSMFVFSVKKMNFEKEMAVRSDVYQAQLWAQKETKETDRFLTDISWRSLSRRMALSPVGISTLLVYSPKREIYERARKLADDFGIDFCKGVDCVPTLRREQYEQFKKTPYSRLAEGAQRNRVNYMVLDFEPAGAPQPPFQKFNSIFIYKLD